MEDQVPGAAVAGVTNSALRNYTAQQLGQPNAEQLMRSGKCEFERVGFGPRAHTEQLSTAEAPIKVQEMNERTNV